MKVRQCKQCGSEIVFSYETPTKTYRIEDDTLVRDDNVLSDEPTLIPHCSNDKEHNIIPYTQEEEKEFWSWADNVYMHFIDRGIYEL